MADGSLVGPAVRAVKTGNVPVEGILKVCARNAWFSMSKRTVLDFHEHAGFSRQLGGSTFDIVFACCKDILGLTDVDLLPLMGLCFLNLSVHTEYLGDMLEVDKAQAYLDESDRQQVKQIQGCQQDRKRGKDEFVQSRRAQRSRIAVACG